MNEIKLFENSQIRSVWDSEKEEWFFLGGGHYRGADAK